MSQAAKRVAKNTGILYARMAVTILISLYSTRLILNALGVIDFGIFNVVAGAIAMLTFLNVAMAGATQRFISFTEGAGDTDKVKTIFNVSIVLHFFIALAVLSILEIVGYFLFHGILNITPARIHTAQLVYQFMIISTLFTIISVPYDAVINANENMLLVALLGVLEALFKLGIAIYITYTSFDKLFIYGLFTAISAVILLLIHRIYCHWRYEECTIKFSKYYDRVVFKEMTIFAGWNLLGASSSMLSSYGQGILLNSFFGTRVNAAQGIAAQVSGQLGAFAVTMLKALNPLIGKSEGGGNRQLMLKATMAGSKIAFFLLILFYVPVLIEMPYIFKIWLKEVPEFVIIFCRLLLIRNMVEQFGITLNSSIAAVGNIRKSQIYGSVLSFLPLLVSYLFFKFNYPASTLYLVFLIYAALNLIQILYFAHKLCGLSIPLYFSAVIFRCVLVFTMMFCIAIIPFFSMDAGLMRLGTVILMSTLSFASGVWLVGLSAPEKVQLTQLLNKIFYKMGLRFGATW